jgi:DNA primase
MCNAILDGLREKISLKEFLLLFNVDFIEDASGTLRGPCPIHGGDNPTSFAAYSNPNGRWAWACHSNDCHLKNGANIIGFIASLKKISIADAIMFLVKKFHLKSGDTALIKSKKHRSFERLMPIKPDKLSIINDGILKKAILNVKKTNYFKKLNISEEIITKFKLGYIEDLSRILIPIFDEEDRFVGYSMRYINDDFIDTVDINGNLIQKYKISYGFKKRDVLYGLNFLKDKVDKIVLVEGFKDVWALSLLNIPAVAVLGHSLSLQQLFLLKQKTDNVIICFDNDKNEDIKNPGQDGAKKVHSLLLKNKFNVINICPPPNVDVGDSFTDKKMFTWLKNNLEEVSGR